MKSLFVFDLRQVILPLACALVLAGCATAPDGKPASPQDGKPVVTVPGGLLEMEPADTGGAREILTRDVFISRNDERMLQVYPGMKREMVHEIMLGYRAEKWRNPCWTEKRVGRNGRIIDVEFYIVRKPTKSRPMGLRVMMPVIYDQTARVDSISRYRLKKLRTQTHLVTKNHSGCPAAAR